MLIQGNSLEVLKTLPDNSFNLIVTSPPYFNLRKYSKVTDSDEIGNEKTYDCNGWATRNRCGVCYICRITAIGNELLRVLHPTGTLWINVGDCYSGSGKGMNSYGLVGNDRKRTYGEDFAYNTLEDLDIERKNLLGIPWRVALSFQSEGWILRSDIVWAKGVSFARTYSGTTMPEGVRDRPARAHEYIFLMSKSPDYFFDIFAGKEDIVTQIDFSKVLETATDKSKVIIGRNPRDVWCINPKKDKVEHYATYPVELIEPIVRMGTSSHGRCTSCKTPYTRLLKRLNDKGSSLLQGEWEEEAAEKGITGYNNLNGRREAGLQRKTTEETIGVYETIGWQKNCKCSTDDIDRCHVLDPFNGAGTTGVAAYGYGMDYTGIELIKKNVIQSNKRLDGVQQNLF